MEKKIGRLPVSLFTAVTAIAVFFLRKAQLLQVDETGKFLSGAGKGPLTWVCVIFALLAVLYAINMKKRDKMAKRSYVATAVTLAAAFCMAMGSAIMLTYSSMMAVLGLVSAVCWVVVALQRHQNTEPSAILFMLPTVFYAVELIVQFRGWSMDPQVLDYGFSLLTGICTMCASFHLGGFGFGKGKRRLTAFYCMVGMIVAAAAMAGAHMVNMLTVGGSALWLLANLWLLLEKE